MPGLWGLIGDGPSDELATLAHDMGRRLVHHDSYRVDRYAAEGGGPHLGRASLGFVNRDDQPASNEDGSLLAMMEGELLDYDEQRRRLEAAGHTFRGDSQAEVLLHGFEQRGRDFFRDLNGPFAAAIWDGRHRRLILANDRLRDEAALLRQGGRPAASSPRRSRRSWPTRAVARGAAPSRGSPSSSRSASCWARIPSSNPSALLPAAGWLTYEPDADRLQLGRYWRLGAGAGGAGWRGREALDRIDDGLRPVGRALHVRGRIAWGSRSPAGSTPGRCSPRSTRTRTPRDGRQPGHGREHRRPQPPGRWPGAAGCPHHRYQLDGTFLSRFEEHLRLDGAPDRRPLPLPVHRHADPAAVPRAGDRGPAPRPRRRTDAHAQGV